MTNRKARRSLDCSPQDRPILVEAGPRPPDTAYRREGGREITGRAARHRDVAGGACSVRHSFEVAAGLASFPDESPVKTARADRAVSHAASHGIGNQGRSE